MSLQSAGGVRVKEEPEWEMSAQGSHVEHTDAGRMVKKERQWEVCVVYAAEGRERKEDGQADREVKQEEWESGSSVSEAAALAGLYRGHVVKEEVVLGPEELHRPKLLVKQEPFEAEDQNEQSGVKSTTNNKPLVLQSTPVKERSHKCTYCTYATDIKENLQRHVRIHYRCVYYNRSFFTEANFLLHVDKCAHCTDASAKKNNLQILKKAHAQARIQGGGQLGQFAPPDARFLYWFREKCPPMTRRCPPPEQNPGSPAHASVKRYKCPHCIFATAYSKSFAVHTMIHTGEKPYKCDQCSYAGAAKCYLKSHKRIHSKEKPYKCDYCSFATTHKSNLKVHNKNHTGEKKYKCGQCSYASASKRFLRRHKKAHKK